MRCLLNRGFVLTLDAILAFVIAIGLSNALVLFLDQEPGLSQEYLYALAQDMMEVCSKKADFSSGCFGLLNELGLHYSFSRGGVREFGEEGVAEAEITRHVSGGEIELGVWP